MATHPPRHPSGVPRQFSWSTYTPSIIDAIIEVHRSNKADKHGSPRWGQYISYYTVGKRTQQQIENWGLSRATTLDAINMSKQACQHCGILTMEDFIVRFGSAWGVQSYIIHAARNNVRDYDAAWGGKRWV